METAKRAQIFINEGLHAERYAVYAGCTISGETTGLDARRVGLKSNFDVGAELPVGGDFVENCGNRRWLHQ